MSFDTFDLMTYTKSQGQGHTHLNNEYSGNDERYGKYYYCRKMTSYV